MNWLSHLRRDLRVQYLEVVPGRYLKGMGAHTVVDEYLEHDDADCDTGEDFLLRVALDHDGRCLRFTLTLHRRLRCLHPGWCPRLSCWLPFRSLPRLHR